MNKFDDICNYPLLELQGIDEADDFYVYNSFEGVHIFGATGSGKSSGSGQIFARSFLEAGYGGLVLTVKPSDVRDWLKYAKLAKRENDVIIFNPKLKAGFNFLEYEAERAGQGAGITENLVNLFTTVVEVAERGNKATGEAFWIRSLKHLLRNAIDLLLISRQSVSLPNLYNLVQSAPNSIEERDSKKWQESSYCFECLCLATQHHTPQNEGDFDLVDKYFLQEYPNLAEKTRSIIVSMFTNIAGIFLRGDLKRMFCEQTSVTPEDIFNGKILILDLPVKEWGELGLYTQLIFKYCFQQAVERRDIKKSGLPIFIWADEAQNFITNYDQNFLTTARSSRVSMVYLTQNIPNYYAVLGSNAKSVVNSLLGNFQTKIFHQNSDVETNEYASKLIGRRTTYKSSYSHGSAGNYQSEQISRGFQESLEYLVQPHEFNDLKKGGTANNLAVEGIVFQGGRKWSEGEIYKKAIFMQE